MYNPAEKLIMALASMALPCLISLALAFSAKSYITKRIPEGKKFSGIEFGLFNGIFGSIISLAWVLPIISSLNKKVDTIQDPNYAQYCRKQLKLFLWVYLGIMIGASVLFGLFIFK